MPFQVCDRLVHLALIHRNGVRHARANSVRVEPAVHLHRSEDRGGPSVVSRPSWTELHRSTSATKVAVEAFSARPVASRQGTASYRDNIVWY